MKLLTRGLAAATLLAATAATAQAENPRAATYLPDANVQTVHAFVNFAPRLAEATNSEIQFELFTGGVLLPARSILSGVGSGVAQMGFHSSNYTPSELPVPNAIQGLGFENPDPHVLGFAFADWAMHETYAYDQFRHNGVVPVGGFSTPTYVLICNTSEPVQTLDDIRGKKIRISGGQVSKLAWHLGVTPVSLPATEIYQALQNGQIDCANILATYLDIDMQLHEVARSVTDIRLPPTFNDGMQVYNTSYWQGLTTEQRATILDLAATAMAEMLADFTAKHEASLQFARDKGMPVVEPEADLSGAIQEWIGAGAGDLVGEAAKLGVSNPEEVLDSFRTYVEKWDGLLDGVTDRNDAGELTALLKANLFNTIDPATYGME